METDPVNMRIDLIGMIFLGLVCLAWVVYCVKKGRTYSTHLGWHTREEWPKLFWFELLFPAAIGLGMLVFSIKTLLGY